MTTQRPAPRRRQEHNNDPRKEHFMLHPELRLAAAKERQELLRSIRDEVSRRPGQRRSIRRQVGESLMRLGRRIAGEHASTPVWSG